jgi:hypothetical protein
VVVVVRCARLRTCENVDGVPDGGARRTQRATHNHNYYVGHKNRMITREAQRAADLGLVTPGPPGQVQEIIIRRLDSRYSLSASLAFASNHHVGLVVASTRSLARIAHRPNHALDFVRRKP